MIRAALGLPASWFHSGDFSRAAQWLRRALPLWMSAHLGILLLQGEWWFGEEAFVSRATARQWIPGAWAEYWMPGGGAEAVFLYALFGAGVVAGLFYSWGRFRRTCAILLWVCFQTLNYRFVFIESGGDYLGKFAATYLVLDAFLSASLRLQALLPRLMQLQLAVIYLGGALWKAVQPGWWSGEAIYLALQSENFSRFAGSDLPRMAWLYSAAGAGVILSEALLATLVFWRRGRLFCVALGALLHLGIEVCLNIGTWQILMVLCVPCFLRDRDWPGRPGSGIEKG